MEFHFMCMDCAKFGNACHDMTGTEPAGSCFEKKLIDKHAAYMALKHEAETHGMSFFGRIVKPDGKSCPKGFYFGKCDKCVLKWLKQEVSEDAAD